MLQISTDTLPQSCLSYVAFRVAFKETLERISLAHQIDDDGAGGFGYLTEVPFLAAVAPHVQLDLLAETWAKHVCEIQIPATLVDEGVVYAACETAANIVEQDTEMFIQHLAGGPLDVSLEADHFLSSELRSLHLNLSNDGDFLLISQFEDMDPEQARLRKRELDLDESTFEPMFEVLGLWTMSAEFLNNLDGLLSEREIIRTVTELGRK